MARGETGMNGSKRSGVLQHGHGTTTEHNTALPSTGQHQIGRPQPHCVCDNNATQHDTTTPCVGQRPTTDPPFWHAMETSAYRRTLLLPPVADDAHTAKPGDEGTLLSGDNYSRADELPATTRYDQQPTVTQPFPTPGTGEGAVAMPGRNCRGTELSIIPRGRGHGAAEGQSARATQAPSLLVIPDRPTNVAAALCWQTACRHCLQTLAFMALTHTQVFPTESDREPLTTATRRLYPNISTLIRQHFCRLEIKHEPNARPSEAPGRASQPGGGEEAGTAEARTYTPRNSNIPGNSTAQPQLYRNPVKQSSAPFNGQQQQKQSRKGAKRLSQLCELPVCFSPVLPVPTPDWLPTGGGNALSSR
ncbi:hypothetical protein Bbelb_096360 [Branchiostoma belcheri]|nr:hypothetical protein Bbelb_096360 [Branchiostoma belcheri]